MKHTNKKYLMAVLIPIIAVLITLFPSAAPANAGILTTEGCTGFGKSITVRGIGFTQGTYCAYINGQGRNVSNVVGHFGVVGTVCNWNITAEFWNKDGKYLKTINGKYHGNCTPDAWDTINVNWKMPTDGMLCSTLKSNGSRITSVCNSIHQ